MVFTNCGGSDHNRLPKIKLEIVHRNKNLVPSLGWLANFFVCGTPQVEARNSSADNGRGRNLPVCARFAAFDKRSKVLELLVIQPPRDLWPPCVPPITDNVPPPQSPPKYLHFVSKHPDIFLFFDDFTYQLSGKIRALFPLAQRQTLE